MAGVEGRLSIQAVVRSHNDEVAPLLGRESSCHANPKPWHVMAWDWYQVFIGEQVLAKGMTHYILDWLAKGSAARQVNETIVTG